MQPLHFRRQDCSSDSGRRRVIADMLSAEDQRYMAFMLIGSLGCNLGKALGSELNHRKCSGSNTISLEDFQFRIMGE